MNIEMLCLSEYFDARIMFTSFRKNNAFDISNRPFIVIITNKSVVCFVKDHNVRI